MTRNFRQTIVLINRTAPTEARLVHSFDFSVETALSMYFLAALVTLGLAFNPRRNSQGLDWCEYWNALGIEKPECSFRSRVVFSTTTEEPQPLLPSICTTRYFFSTCTQDYRCDSNLLCIDVDSVSCCQPPRGICPTTHQLGFSCLVKNPQNWCVTDEDCGNRGKCCPTGCDYNICV